MAGEFHCDRFRSYSEDQTVAAFSAGDLACGFRSGQQPPQIIGWKGPTNKKAVGFSTALAFQIGALWRYGSQQ